MRKKLICLALSALCLSEINHSYSASDESLFTFAKNLLPEAKGVFDLFKFGLSIINGSANTGTAQQIAHLSQLMENMEKQLSLMQKYEKEVQNNIDQNFFNTQLTTIDNRFTKLQDLLNSSALDSEDMINSPVTLKNGVKATKLLYDAFYPKNNHYSSNNYKKPSSTINLEQYVKTSLFNSQEVMDTVTNSVIIQFISSSTEILNQLPNNNYLITNEMKTNLLDAIDTTMTSDVGNAIYWYNIKLLRETYELNWFLQKQYIVAQTLIALKKSNPKFKDLNLEGLPSDNYSSLDKALNANSIYSQIQAQKLTSIINPLFINGMSEVIGKYTGITNINYPTTDSHCFMVNFIPQSNSFGIKCTSTSNAALSNQVYKATVGNLIQDEILENTITLVNYQNNNLPAQIKFAKFTNVKPYNFNSFANSFIPSSHIWLDQTSDLISAESNMCLNDVSTGLINAFYYSEFYSKNGITKNPNAFFSFSDGNSDWEFGNMKSWQAKLSKIVYMPYSGSFVQINSNLNSDCGYTSQFMKGVINIQPLKHDLNSIPNRWNEVFPDKWLGGYSSNYQLAFNSGETISYHGNIANTTKNTIDVANYKAEEDYFEVTPPPFFSYKNKQISIGGSWSSHYDVSNVFIEEHGGPGVPWLGIPSSPYYIQILKPIASDGLGKTEVLFDSRTSEMADQFNQELNQIVNGRDRMGTINFKYSPNANNGITLE